MNHEISGDNTHGMSGDMSKPESGLHALSAHRHADLNLGHSDHRDHRGLLHDDPLGAHHDLLATTSLLDGGGHPSLVGTPEHDAQFAQLQTTDFTCDISAEAGIISEFTGHPLSEAEATHDATLHGWLSRDGVKQASVGRLLNLYGVQTHALEHASMRDVMAELAMGHKVILGVSAHHLYDDRHELHAFVTQAEHHAVWVTGVDLSVAGHPVVIVNDSTDPNGRGARYPVSTFEKAWGEWGYRFVATNHAPPALHEHSPQYDPAIGAFPALRGWLKT